MDAFSKYKSTIVSTSNTSYQLIFIFDEIIKLFYQAQKSLTAKDYETKYKALSKIVEVLYTLKSGIDSSKKGSETIKVLDDFYSATIDRIEQINIVSKEPEDLTVILNAFIEIRNSIKESQEKDK